MDDITQMKEFTRAVLRFVGFKTKAFKELSPFDESVISRDLVENARKIVWIEKYIIANEYLKFFSDHVNRVRSRVDYHTLYIIYLCYQIKKCFTNVFEIFIQALTFLSTLLIWAIYIKPRDALKVSSIVITHFYEEIRADFNEQGGFENFEIYLKQRDTLRLYSDLLVLEEAKEKGPNIVKLLELQPTCLAVHLSQDFKREDIEAHVPSRRLLNDVLHSGWGYFQKVCCGTKLTRSPEHETEKNSQAVGESEKPYQQTERRHPEGEKNSQAVDESVKPCQQTERRHPEEREKNSQAVDESEKPFQQTDRRHSKKAYAQARKQIADFYSKLEKVEKLLDFLFKDTS